MKIIGKLTTDDWTWGALEEGRVAKIGSGYHTGKLFLKISDERGINLKENYHIDDTIVALFKEDIAIDSSFDAELRLG